MCLNQHWNLFVRFSLAQEKVIVLKWELLHEIPWQVLWNRLECTIIMVPSGLKLQTMKKHSLPSPLKGQELSEFFYVIITRTSATQDYLRFAVQKYIYFILMGLSACFMSNTSTFIITLTNFWFSPTHIPTVILKVNFNTSPSHFISLPLWFIFLSRTLRTESVFPKK